MIVEDAARTEARVNLSVATLFHRHHIERRACRGLAHGHLWSRAEERVCSDARTRQVVDRVVAEDVAVDEVANIVVLVVVEIDPAKADNTTDSFDQLLRNLQEIQGGRRTNIHTSTMIRPYPNRQADADNASPVLGVPKHLGRRGHEVHEYGVHADPARRLEEPPQKAPPKRHV